MVSGPCFVKATEMYPLFPKRVRGPELVVTRAGKARMEKASFLTVDSTLDHVPVLGITSERDRINRLVLSWGQLTVSAQQASQHLGLFGKRRPEQSHHFQCTLSSRAGHQHLWCAWQSLTATLGPSLRSVPRFNTKVCSNLEAHL